MEILINYKRLWVLMFLCYLTGILALPLEHRLRNETTLNTNQNESLLNYKGGHIKNHSDSTSNVKTFDQTTDLVPAAANYQQAQLRLPLAIKPRGFLLPKTRSVEQNPSQTPQPAAQNYYSNYFSDIPSIAQAQPYYQPLTEDPIVAKFLSQQSKQFQPRHQPFSAGDVSILGSGDFGILRGGTFYSNEEQSYINEEGSDFYYGDASNTHAVTATEGFIQKYTYPEDQFAQFRDFADLGTPTDSDFSQYVVVYAARNATISDHQSSKPKNIFEQLQEIDKEKALEQKKRRKNQTNSSITKLKLVKTKLMEKKWVQKQPVKVIDDDPLLALS